MEKARSNRRLEQRQVEQVGLDEGDVRQVGAECGGLLDGRAEVHADDPSAVPAREPGVPSAAATGVEHERARQFARRHPGLDRKRRRVLLVPRHVVAVPLPPEARGV